jgi:hypothetical protein
VDHVVREEKAGGRAAVHVDAGGSVLRLPAIRGAVQASVGAR